MPVPAGPRRAAPPRRKKETPKSSDEPPPPSQEEETAAPEAKIADAEGEKVEVPSDGDSKLAHATEPSPPVEGESPEPIIESGLVTERSTSPTLVRSGDRDDVPEDARAPSPREEHPIHSLPEEKLAEVAGEGKKEIEELSGIDQPKQDLKEPPNRLSSDGEPAKSLGTTVEKEEEPEALTPEPGVKEDADDKPEGQLEKEEEEEDEATRRASIADRLAKSGGFNPFAGGPPVRKPSESSLLERRTSVEVPGSFNPTLHEEQEPSTQSLARRDVDSLGDEADLPAMEAEGNKPFDTLKQFEGDS